MGDADANAAFDLLESSPHALIAFSFDLQILAVNGRHCAMTGQLRDDVIGRPLFEAFPANPDAPDASAEAPLRASVARVRRSGEPDSMPIVQHDVERPDEPGVFDQRHWQLTHSPLRGRDGEMRGVLQTAREVTAEVAARHVEDARRRSAESAGKVRFWGVDLESGEMLRFQGVDRLFGFSPEELHTITHLVERVHPADRAAVLAEFDRARRAPIGTAFDTDYRIVRPDGSLRHVNSLAEVVSVKGGRRMTGVLIDTTAIHRREDSLRRMVEEKQALLADVNHRVKNSLQLVSSLLRIEERSVTSGPLAEPMRLTAGRVAAIAAVHSSLYHHADVSRVNVSEHLHRFCGQVSEDHDGRLVLRLEDEPLYLSAEKAVPLALLVNELVTDALAQTKESQPDDDASSGERAGQVVLRLEYQGNALLLRLENGGTRRCRKPGPLGSRLFDALLAQLGGTFTQDGADGRNACIEFERS